MLENKQKVKKEEVKEVDKNGFICLPLCKPGVEYEDTVRLFWAATRTNNCKVKKDEVEGGGKDEDVKAAPKKDEEKDVREEGVRLLPVTSA